MDRTRSRRATLSAALGIALVAVAGFSAFAPAASAQTKRTTEDVGLGFKGDAGELARNIRIAPIVEYWSVGQDVGPYNADLKDFSLGADLNIDFPLQDSRVTPYAGGGLGLHWIKATTNVPNIADQSETKLGLNIQGGVRTDVMPNLALFGELRYNFVSDANQLKLLGGFTYRFIY